jgi:hypothetical protein
MRAISTVILMGFLVTACGHKKDDRSAASDQPAGPSQIDVQTIWADFAGGLQGMALSNKYHDPVTFTAVVKSVGEDMDHAPILMLDVDGKNMISIKFTDPKVVSAKPPKAGDSLAVTCKIVGANKSLMMAIDCTL